MHFELKFRALGTLRNFILLLPLGTHHDPRVSYEDLLYPHHGCLSMIDQVSSILLLKFVHRRDVKMD